MPFKSEIRDDIEHIKTLKDKIDILENRFIYTRLYEIAEKYNLNLELFTLPYDINEWSEFLIKKLTLKLSGGTKSRKRRKSKKKTKSIKKRRNTRKKRKSRKKNKSIKKRRNTRKRKSKK